MSDITKDTILILDTLEENDKQVPVKDISGVSTIIDGNDYSEFHTAFIELFNEIVFAAIQDFGATKYGSKAGDFSDIYNALKTSIVDDLKSTIVKVTVGYTDMYAYCSNFALSNDSDHNNYNYICSHLTGMNQVSSDIGYVLMNCELMISDSWIMGMISCIHLD